MHICFKIVKFLLQYMFALHVSDTTVSIIRSLPPPHMQPLVTVWCCVGCVLQPCSVPTEQGWRTQPTQNHTVTRGCMCGGGRLLMMDSVVSETYRANIDCNKNFTILKQMCIWLVFIQFCAVYKL
jgi:hypothetical protein